MACCGRREREKEVKAEEKWDYINLQDFRTSSCLKPLSYGVLFISLFISVSVYAIDTFTAINLLIFKRWSSEVKPPIPFSISRWIFSACIILSFLILIFEWVRAVRVIKRGGVAESYLDPLAVRVQSIRTGENGQGWRRFLVFTQLTKSKKGTEYVALFTYFSFKAWIRIVFAEGPRQVINALTLYSVVRAHLVPVGAHAAPVGHSAIIQFFINIRILANSSRNQAIVLSGMAWTLLVWVISALNLMVAVILYLVFLWHHIPVSDGGLAGYLNRKVDAKVRKIVAVKVQKALDKENAQRDADEAKGLNNGKKREPTVPTLGGFGSTDDLIKYPGLARQSSEPSLPAYSSRRSSSTTLDRQQPPKPPPADPWGHPYPPSRTNTLTSTSTAPTYRSATPNSSIQSPIDPRYDLDDPYSNNITPPPRRAMTPMGIANNNPDLYPRRQQSPAPQQPPYGRRTPAPPPDLDARLSPAPRDPYGRFSPPAPYSDLNRPANATPPPRNMSAPPRQLYFPPNPTPRSTTAPLPPPSGGAARYEDVEMQQRGFGRARPPFDGRF